MKERLLCENEKLHVGENIREQLIEEISMDYRIPELRKFNFIRCSQSEINRHDISTCKGKETRMFSEA